MKFIDDILNRISMYRLVLYYLAALVLVAFVLTRNIYFLNYFRKLKLFVMCGKRGWWRVS